ncbi:unnamed protein product [Xylocopa violacea]|uniref:Uncharacterized protein n=1 Tax=Xylocopa violacea TaxID=135666 RepID=A0ABP1NPR0_XYLVO
MGNNKGGDMKNRVQKVSLFNQYLNRLKGIEGYRVSNVPLFRTPSNISSSINALAKQKAYRELLLRSKRVKRNESNRETMKISVQALYAIRSHGIVPIETNLVIKFSQRPFVRVSISFSNVVIEIIGTAS